MYLCTLFSQIHDLLTSSHGCSMYTHRHTLFHFASHHMLSPDIMTRPPKHLVCLSQKQRPPTQLHLHDHTECNKQ